MSEFRFDCPRCTKSNVIQQSNVGHVVRCTHCKVRIAWDGDTPVLGPADEPPPPRRTNWSQVGGALLAFLVSVPTLITGSLDLYWAVRSKSWASVNGEIIFAGTEAGPDATSSQGTGIHVDDTTAAVIRYRYTIDGEVYKGDTVRFGQVYSSSSLIGAAGETLKRHPVGPAKIYVAREDPALSVLEPGLTAAAFLKPCVSLMFFGVGMWMLCSGIGVLRRN